MYKRNRIRAFIGGQFQEYVFATYGARKLPAFMQEARRVGFEVIEISDNCVPLSDAERCRQCKT